MIRLLYIFLSLLFLYSQGKVSGSVTLESTYTDYNESSKLWSENDEKSIKTDSALNSVDFNLNRYSTSFLVPGFMQNLSLSLFSFTDKYKASFFSRIRYSDWTKPDRMKHIDRMTLNLNFGSNKIVLGDHYLNGNGFFIDQRRIRGAYLSIPISQSNRNVSFELEGFGGLIEFENKIGDPVVGRYQSYYRVNRFDRSMYGVQLKNYFFDKHLEISLGYFTGKDAAEGEIDTLTVSPLKNSVMGASLKAHLYEKQVYLNMNYYQSTTDSIYVTHTSEGDANKSFKVGLGIDNELIMFEFNKYRVEPQYYTFGQPYLIVDRDGFTINNRINFSPKVKLTNHFDIYETNLDNNENAFAISSAELNSTITIPVTKNSNVSLRYDRISDKSSQNTNLRLSDFFLFRVSNSFDLQFSHNFRSYSLSFFTGKTDTEDNGQYGLDTLNQPIKGVSSNRFYVGASASYNASQVFRVQTSLTYNFLEQISVDKTNILNFQLNANYQLSPGVFVLSTILNGTFSGNDLNSNVLNSSGSVSNLRYRLFSAVNEYQQNFAELGAEYFLDYKIRFKLSLRYDSKKYKYLDRSQSELDLLKNSAIELRNPNFFNQKEDYQALSVKLSLSYLL